MARILIVDDSPFSRRKLREILESAGHAVLEAADGLSALERYALEKPQVVLLDMTMSGMHGLDVLEKLRQVEPPASVIVVSADIQEPVQREARAKGALDFLAKPLDGKTILGSVARILSEAPHGPR
jgi:two-component system, chemotaxis family, chemotaxis protein CheY